MSVSCYPMSCPPLEVFMCKCLLRHTTFTFVICPDLRLIPLSLLSCLRQDQPLLINSSSYTILVSISIYIYIYIYIFIHSSVIFDPKVDNHEFPSIFIFRCPFQFSILFPSRPFQHILNPRISWSPLFP